MILLFKRVFASFSLLIVVTAVLSILILPLKMSCSGLKRNPCFQQLKEHYENEMKHVHMRSLFREDAHRFSKFNRLFNGEDGDLLLDFSKNIITEKTFQLLLTPGQRSWCGEYAGTNVFR